MHTYISADILIFYTYTVRQNESQYRYNFQKQQFHVTIFNNLHIFQSTNHSRKHLKNSTVRYWRTQQKLKYFYPVFRPKVLAARSTQDAKRLLVLCGSALAVTSAQNVNAKWASTPNGPCKNQLNFEIEPIFFFKNIPYNEFTKKSWTLWFISIRSSHMHRKWFHVAIVDEVLLNHVKRLVRATMFFLLTIYDIVFKFLCSGTIFYNFDGINFFVL